MNELSDDLRRYYNHLIESVPLRLPTADRRAHRRLVIARRLAIPAAAVVAGLVVLFLTVLSPSSPPITAAGATTCSPSELTASLPDATPSEGSSGAPGQAVPGSVVPGFYPESAGTLLIVGLQNVSSTVCGFDDTAAVTLTTTDGRSRPAQPAATISVTDGPAPPATTVAPGSSIFVSVYVGARMGACAGSAPESGEQLSIDPGDGPITVPITRSLDTGATCTLEVEGVGSGSSASAPGTPVN